MRRNNARPTRQDRRHQLMTSTAGHKPQTQTLKTDCTNILCSEMMIALIFFSKVLVSVLYHYHSTQSFPRFRRSVFSILFPYHILCETVFNNPNIKKMYGWSYELETFPKLLQLPDGCTLFFFKEGDFGIFSDCLMSDSITVYRRGGRQCFFFRIWLCRLRTGLFSQKNIYSAISKILQHKKEKGTKIGGRIIISFFFDLIKKTLVVGGDNFRPHA